jgi:hypothetical protein
MRNVLITAYLDYVNNYLTIERYAEHNELTVDQATTLVSLGKQLHESKSPEE